MQKRQCWLRSLVERIFWSFNQRAGQDHTGREKVCWYTLYSKGDFQMVVGKEDFFADWDWVSMGGSLQESEEELNPEVLTKQKGLIG